MQALRNSLAPLPFLTLFHLLVSVPLLLYLIQLHLTRYVKPYLDVKSVTSLAG